MTGPTLYTIGHSNHPIAEFLRLLTANGITTVADVRSQPLVGLSKEDMFQDRTDLISAACSLRENQIAYSKA